MSRHVTGAVVSYLLYWFTSRYVNRFTRSDAYPLPDISSVFQRVGRSCYITVVDCKAGY